MSDDHGPGAASDAPPATREERAREAREQLQRLIETKDHLALVKLAFEIVQGDDKSLFVDALDAIRQIALEQPALIDKPRSQRLIDFLNDEDDIVRASAVLALKNLVLERPDELYSTLTDLIRQHGAPHCLEESVRLLGHLGTKHPDKIKDNIVQFVSLLHDEDLHVRKRSMDVIKILAKVVPDKIEKELKREIKSEACTGEILDGIDAILTDIIKKRELKGLEEKIQKDKEPVPDLIPDIEPATKKEPEVATTSIEVPPGQDGERDAPVEKTEAEIVQEIGANIEAEFSKIEDASKGPTETRELKEIKTEKDLEPQAPPKPTPEAPPAPVVDVPRDAAPKDDLVKKQMALKEKELSRREEELKQLEIEKKELEIQSREFDMEREELKRAKLEQMEAEVRRKEQELKEKELALKLKELDEKEKRLKEMEAQMSKEP